MKPNFRIVTMGYGQRVLERVFFRVAQVDDSDYQYVLPPDYVPENLPEALRRADVHCVRTSLRETMPDPDPAYLASLERPGVPTIRNIVLSDRVVSKLAEHDALSYLTFLGRRFAELFERLDPSVVVTGTDGVHSCMAFAVARSLGIPIFSIFFSVIPTGMMSFGTGVLPSSRVVIREQTPSELRRLAVESLEEFESGKTKAYAYIPPKPRGLERHVRELPRRLGKVASTIKRGRDRAYWQYTEKKTSLGVVNAIRFLRQRHLNRRALGEMQLETSVPSDKFVAFGFHFQPESSIDVWAPFFSDQQWVVNLLSRSVPPDVNILAKVHKSDISSRSRAQLQYLVSLPGVRIVAPHVDSRALIERAKLVVAIQGTVGLEAALLGKPTIMLGSSPVCEFPSVSEVGTLRELPTLVRSKLNEAQPERDEIVEAYMRFLAPYFSASHNVWSRSVSDAQIDGYRGAFAALREYVNEGANASTAEGSYGG